MKGMIGARLKLARAAAGMSLRALEERLGGLVTAQAIGKYERDAMMPSSRVLIALAAALGVTEEHLLNTGDVELVKVEFRKHRLTTPKEDAIVRARILSEVERYLEIERILHLDSSEADLPRRRVVRGLDGAESAAYALRDYWKLGADALPNLCEFLEEKGVKVCAIDLPEKVSGVQAMVRTAAGDPLPVIVVNATHTGERQRFTIAHELGHLCLSPSQDVDIEAACHRFAGAFLVPRDILIREVGLHRRSFSAYELLALKVLFGISAQALAYRCKDTDIISQGTLDEVFGVFKARGWRLNEPLPFRPERPVRFKRLCLRALAEGLISESKASELLQKTVRDVDHLMNTPPEGFDGPGPRL
jgi:Zn-dependent peptidase ImmA (M78 family)